MFNTCALRIQKILLSWFSALSFVLLIRADIIKWPLQLEQVFGVDYCIAIPKDIVGICSCFYTHTRKDKTVACYVLLYHVLQQHCNCYDYTELQFSTFKNNSSRASRR